MSFEYVIVKDNEELDKGTVSYQSTDTFERYQVFKQGTYFNDVYKDGAHIHLYNEQGDRVKTYRFIPSVYLEKWNNWTEDAPERMEGINLALEQIDRYGIVQVCFDYIGFTADEIAAHAFTKRLEKEGHTDLTCRIGYREPFIIERVAEDQALKV